MIVNNTSTGVEGSMLITWTTFDYTESVVEYGLWGGKLFSRTAKGNSTLFIDAGSEKRKMYIHRVTVPELRPGAKYGKHNMHCSGVMWCETGI